MEYVISDTHWFHGNILTFENRPFENVNEMNKFMISEWNSVIGKNDLVYHLGDVAFTNKFEVLMNLLNQLNGKIYLITGNHDHPCMRNNVPRFQWIENKLFIGDLITEKKVKINDKYEKVVMSHYPLASWNAGYHGRKHFYGHVHSRASNAVKNLNSAFNVGCDVIGYKPMTFQQVVNFYLTNQQN